jgi:hypothetical protein
MIPQPTPADLLDLRRNRATRAHRYRTHEGGTGS